MKRNCHRVLVAVLASTLAWGVACRRESEEPPPAQTAPAPAPAARFVSVTRVDLGSALAADKSIAAKGETFKPNDTIYVSVVTEGSAPSATLAARWSYENGQLVDESSQSIAPTGLARTEFHISKPDGWPEGRYTVDISLNGVQAGSKTFEVRN